jgi:glycosyltransferase involved in cell wall biosynthesis
VTNRSPAVSVVIPARDAAGSLPRALDSVAHQTYENIREIVVAAADETTAQAARGLALVVDNPDRTTSSGLNRAIAATTGEVVVRCDAQAVLPPDYVELAVETLIRTGADNVGGMQVPVGETPWQQAIGAAMASPFGAGDARYRVGGEEGPAETVFLGVFRRQALERVGGFDEDFVRTQDYELNHRIIETGGIVWFQPAMKVEYRPRGSLRELARQYFEYGQAKRHLNRKHPGSLKWRQLAAPLLLVTLTTALIFSIWIPWLLIIPLAYGVGLILAGVRAAGSPLRIGAALATMHLSWGLGFLLSRA